jgi:hypothetical protein
MKIRLVVTIPRDIYQNIVFPSQQHRISLSTISYFPYSKFECFIPPGQRFGEFCQMKSFGHLCLQNYYFGTSL